MYTLCGKRTHHVTHNSISLNVDIPTKQYMHQCTHPHMNTCTPPTPSRRAFNNWKSFRLKEHHQRYHAGLFRTAGLSHLQIDGIQFTQTSRKRWIDMEFLYGSSGVNFSYEVQTCWMLYIFIEMKHHAAPYKQISSIKFILYCIVL